MYKQLLLIAFLGTILIAGCDQEEEEPAEELVRTVNVETKTVEPQKFERYLKLVGTVKTEDDVRISSEVSGRVQRYFVEKGDRIKRGEPILQIDDSQLRREQERLEAITEQARENYERLKRLFEEDSVGSEIEYLNARYNYEQNKASLEAVKVNLSKTTITAPFDATLEQKMVEEGEMAGVGTILVRLIGSDRLKVTAGVPSIYSDVVDKGDLARVWFDFQRSDTLSLPITFVGQSIDQQARTFGVDIRLPKGDSSYKVDMLANVMIQTMELDNAVVVSNEFIHQDNGGNVVYTVGTDGNGRSVANRIPVRLGASYRNDVVIEDGLKPGDELITIGSSFLQDSMRIAVVDNVDSGLAQRN